MEDVKGHHVLTFGNWDIYDELPITQYFESAAREAGLFPGGHFFGEGDDLYKVEAPTKPVYYHKRKGSRKREGTGEKKHEKEQKQKKQCRVYDVTNQQPTRRPIAPKTVDEDLYKIPPELLYQKPKKVKLLRNFWSGCLGLNCFN